jgi:flagellar protein FlbT
MALKINMKPRDSVYIGSSAITVASDGNVTLLIEGDAPVLRGSERIAEPHGDDPMSRIQYIIQQMYLLRDIASFHEDYFTLAQKLIREDSDMAPHIARINCHLVAGEFYKALKTVRDVAGQTDPGTPEVRAFAK